MEHDVLVVIPARLEAKRFPGKPLIEVDGHPLLWYAWHTASTWPRVRAVVVASPDEAILEAAKGFGAVVQHSDPACRNGSQRAFAVHLRNPADPVVVNLQCDEPEITHAMLDAVVEPVVSGLFTPISTLTCNFAAEHPPADPNVVKVVYGADGRALYFSRQPLPCSRRHIGVYAFRGNCCERLAREPESLCGRTERLEQLDWLAAGWCIKVVATDERSYAVSTPCDMEVFKLRAKERREHDAAHH